MKTIRSSDIDLGPPLNRPFVPTTTSDAATTEQAGSSDRGLTERLKPLRKTDAELNFQTQQLLYHGELTQQSLGHVINWCCDHGEADLLDEVLHLVAATQGQATQDRLVVPRVSIAADTDDHTAAVLKVLAKHSIVKAIDLFRREEDGTIVGASIGANAQSALAEILVGLKDQPSHLTHLGIANPRLPAGPVKGFIDTLTKAVRAAPQLISLGFDCETIDGAYAMRVATAVCGNPRITVFSLTLMDDDSANGKMLAQSLLSSNVSDLRLRCDEAWVHSNLVEHLALNADDCPVSIIRLASATGRIEAATPILYTRLLDLVRSRKVWEADIDGIGINAERLKPVSKYAKVGDSGLAIDNSSSSEVEPDDSVDGERDASVDIGQDENPPLEGSSEAQAGAPVVPKPPPLQCSLVVFNWPDSNLPEAHLAYITDAVKRNCKEFQWPKSAQLVGAIGQSLGEGQTIAYAHEAGRLVGAFMSQSESTTMRDVKAMAILNRTSHGLVQKGLSDHFKEQIVQLLNAHQFEMVREVVGKMAAAGIGLEPQHLGVVRQLVNNMGVHHLVTLPALQQQAAGAGPAVLIHP